MQICIALNSIIQNLTKWARTPIPYTTDTVGGELCSELYCTCFCALKRTGTFASEAEGHALILTDFKK